MDSMKCLEFSQFLIDCLFPNLEKVYLTTSSCDNDKEILVKVMVESIKNDIPFILISFRENRVSMKEWGGEYIFKYLPYSIFKYENI